MTIEKDTYIGKGVVYIKNRASGGYRFLSNVESITNAFETDKKTVPNNVTAGGGYWDTLDRIKGATASAVLFDLSAANLALATNGAVSAVTAAAVTAEALTVTAIGEIIPTEFMIDTATPPVVKDHADTTTYVLGTDYSVSPAGITPLGSTIIAADVLHVGYTKKATSVVDMLTSAAGEYSLMIDGLNEANSGKPVRIIMHRCKASAAKQLDFISDNFAKLSVDFDMLADASITAAGKSQYATIEMAA